MKRKLLSVLLTFCLAFSLLPTAALADEGDASGNVAKIGEQGYATLQAAINAATTENSTVTLLKDVTELETISITGGKKVDLNLNEKNITFKADNYFLVDNGALNVTGKGNITSSHGNDNNTWLPTIYAYGTDTDTANYSVVTVGKDVVIDNRGSYGLAIGHKDYKAYGAKVIVEGTVKSTYGFTVTGNAKATQGNIPEITVTESGKIVSTDGSAIYAAGYGIYTIAGTLSGTEFGIEIRAGKLNVEDTAKISATGNFSDPVPNGNGSTVTGAAIAVSQHTTNLPIDVNIKGGEISETGTNGHALYEIDTVRNEEAGNVAKDVSITVSGGSFNGNVYSTNNKLSITGGAFTDIANAVKYAADNATIKLAGDVTQDVTIPDGKTVTLDLGGNKLTNVSGHTITNNGTLFVTGNGTVDNIAHGKGALYNNTGATATLNGGTFTRSAEKGTASPDSANGNSWYTVKNYGTMTINSNVTITNTGSHSSAVANGWFDVSKAGSNGEPIYTTNAVLTINGGNISGGKITVKNDDYGTLTITGGPISQPLNGLYCIYNANVTAISGGNVNGPVGNYNGTSTEADQGKFSITGGYFTSDPSAYLAEGKGLVTSDQSAFAYKVGDKATNVETAVTAGEAAVTIPAGVPGITKDNVKNAAKAANTTKTLTDTVAATGMTNDPAVVGTKEAAEAALTKKGITVNSGETVTVVVQPYLEVNVKSADAGKLTLEISAKYNVVATTGNPVTIDLTKTAILKSGVPLSINKPIELTIVLPTSFATASSSIYVQHKGYEYTATVDASGTTATFINPHGFSTFTVTPTASAVAEVDGTSYTDLQKAVDAVANNGTVKLLNDTSASAVVSRAVKFTLDKNSKSFTGAITAGSGYELSVDGNVYTFTVRSSSGSSGSSSYDPTYSVSTPSKTEHGTVTVSPKSASKGDRVTVTVKPDSGYVLETLTVTDKNGNELTLKDKGNGKYTFTMPAGKVEVKATFMEDNSMLNFFYDVPNNAYFYEAVKWAVKNGITTGVGNDLFAPEQPCTRAQIVTFLWRAAGSPEPKGAASGMTDVVSGSYYEKAVAWAIENGITTGTTTSTFSPDATCTRAQAVTFLARALKAKAASAAEFSDVPTGSYFADAVAWAAANGVTEGIGGGLFGSDNDCTRGQIVTFLYRAYNK